MPEHLPIDVPGPAAPAPARSGDRHANGFGGHEWGRGDGAAAGAPDRAAGGRGRDRAGGGPRARPTMRAPSRRSHGPSARPGEAEVARLVAEFRARGGAVTLCPPACLLPVRNGDGLVPEARRSAPPPFLFWD